MLEVQQKLHELGLQGFIDLYKIDVKRHSQYSNLVLLKYNQLESPRNSITNQCRGIILDEANNWAVISRAYDRFFNYLEPGAAEIDWNTAKVYNKLDGSLCVLYYYNGAWEVQTSGMPDASGNINGSNQTFAELFWTTFDKMGYDIMDIDDGQEKDFCYSMELMSPLNRVIVPHKESHLKLHGVRHLPTQKEERPEYFAEKHFWECVESFPLQSWEQIQEAAKHLDPMVQEGYVITDGNFSRVKLKTVQYIALAHLRDSMNDQYGGHSKLLQIIRNNESTEFLAYFPEWRSIFEQVQGRYDRAVNELSSLYSEKKDIISQKDFALSIKYHSLAGALFSLRKGHVSSIREYLANINLKSLVEALDIKSIKP